MKTILLLLLITSSAISFAQERIVEIHEDNSFLSGYTSLYLDNGMILHFDSSRTDILDQAKQARDGQIGIIYTFKNESKNIVQDISVFLYSEKTPLFRYLFKNKYLLESREYDNSGNDEDVGREIRDPMESAYLSTLPSYEAAQTLMETFNGETHEDSQCYNRAYMWNYEASELHNANLGKIWIFFTKKYIREYDYKWWFHVAPFAKVDDENERYILDRGFTMVPYNVTNWKNIFIKSKTECTVIKDYRQYRNHQQETDCYFIFSSQHFWQPYQLKKFVRRSRYNVSTYPMGALKIAYKDALIEWDGEIPMRPE